MTIEANRLAGCGRMVLECAIAAVLFVAPVAFWADLSRQDFLSRLLASILVAPLALCVLHVFLLAAVFRFTDMRDLSNALRMHRITLVVSVMVLDVFLAWRGSGGSF